MAPWGRAPERAHLEKQSNLTSVLLEMSVVVETTPVTMHGFLLISHVAEFNCYFYCLIPWFGFSSPKQSPITSGPYVVLPRALATSRRHKRPKLAGMGSILS